jgi:hypothetical protein
LRDKQEALARKQRAEKSDAERDEKLLQEMMAKASELASSSTSHDTANGQEQEVGNSWTTERSYEYNLTLKE